MSMNVSVARQGRAAQTYKWQVMVVVMFGLFMVMLDTTIVNIAIPHLQATFGAALTDISWVATGYTLAEGAGIPLAPTLSARLGTKRFYMLILAFFTLGSALCGLAWNLTALIIFRILQGIAGAGMIPMSMSMLLEEFPPEERGVAMGSLGIPLLVAPALGPTVGGYIVTFVDWRVMFYLNVPVGIVGFFLASILLHESQPQEAQRFDAPGFLFSSVGLASLLYAFSSAGDYGWGSSRVVTFLCIGLVSLGIFITVELLTIQSGKLPLLDLRIFRTFSFSGGCLALTLTMFALYGVIYLSTLYLQVLRGLSAFDAGLILLPQALGSAVASGIGGRLVDKLGVRIVVLPGLVILGLVLWNMGHLTLATPFVIFQILLIARGLGQGLIGQPVIVSSMAEIPPEQNTQASTLSSVVRSVSSSFAVALVSTEVTTRTTFHYVRLAEQVTPDSPTAQTLQRVASVLAQSMPQQSAMLIAAGRVISYLQQQAYMLAMNDVFMLSLVAVFLTGVVVMVTAHNPRKEAPATSGGQARGSVAASYKQTVESKGASVNEEAKKHAALHEQGKEAAVKNTVTKEIAMQKAPIKQAGKRKRNRRALIFSAIILVLLIGVGVGGYLFYLNNNFYSTDDAQVTGTLVSITPPISGTLLDLDVEVGSFVSAKQVIGTVQPSGYAPVQHLVAPMDGVIVQVPAVAGQQVNATTIVAQEIDPASVKITAYVDESAIRNIAVGQVVDIHIDAYNTTITGHVSQIVSATAGQFSLLPTTDNSSGNYTKVSQRIPVYIQLDTLDDGSLLPGMSVETTIHLR